MGLIHVLGSLNLAAYSKKLAVLKRSEGWFVGETKLVRPDTSAAGVAEKKGRFALVVSTAFSDRFGLICTGF